MKSSKELNKESDKLQDALEVAKKKGNIEEVEQILKRLREIREEREKL